jgi:hypothetical protein
MKLFFNVQDRERLKELKEVMNGPFIKLLSLFNAVSQSICQVIIRLVVVFFPFPRRLAIDRLHQFLSK